MKGISGVIGSVVVIILLLIAVSLTLVAMNYAYGIEQTESKTIMSQLSQPHVAQVSPNSVVTSGRLVASYIIYPNGRVTPLNETVSGVKSFQSYLDGYPWAVVVFSNGQWVNVTNVQIPSSSDSNSVLGINLVPYYPYPIDPFIPGQLDEFLKNETGYNIPLLNCPLNITEEYNGNQYGHVVLNPSGTPVFGLGRILAIPVTSESGWLNFTITCIPDDYAYINPVGFAIIVQNASNPVLDIIYFAFRYWQEWTPNRNSIYETFAGYRFNFTYGVYQAWIGPNGRIPIGYNMSEFPYISLTNASYGFSNETSNGNYLLQTLTGSTYWLLQYDPIIKVAVRFAPGEPAVMYVWIGNYNGIGISWYKVIMPTSEAPVGSTAYAQPIYQGCCWPQVVGYTYVWPDVTNTSPVNLYTFVPSGNILFDNLPQYEILEPLVPKLGSIIEVVAYTYSPLTEGTVVFNVTYTI